MKIMVLGCGRLGATLATDLANKGHEVTVLDYQGTAFSRLGPEFPGRTVQGDGLDVDVLQEAGAEGMDAFIATTSGDNRNLTASQFAHEVFHVPHAVARISDPLRGEIFKERGLCTVSPTVLGADMIYNALTGAGELVDCT